MIISSFSSFFGFLLFLVQERKKRKKRRRRRLWSVWARENEWRTTKGKGEHVRGINLSLSMTQMLLKQRADHESICLVNEWKEKKNVVSLVQMCLLCTHNQTHAVDLVWKSLIKTLTIKIVDPDSSWPSLWFWEKRRRRKKENKPNPKHAARIKPQQQR